MYSVVLNILCFIRQLNLDLQLKLQKEVVAIIIVLPNTHLIISNSATGSTYLLTLQRLSFLFAKAL